jgi:hypothetical protein
MEDYNSYKIKQFQIIQNTKSKLEFYIIIDEKMRNKGITIDNLLKELKKRINEQINNKIEIIIKEKKSLETINQSDKFKVFISNIKK